MRILKKIEINDNIVLDVFIICQKLRHVQVIKKYRTRTYTQTIKVIPKSIQNPLATRWKASNTAGIAVCEFVINIINPPSHPFYTTLDLQLSFYRPMCYKIRPHCPLLQCPRTTSAILAGAHSYFISSFKYEEKNSCHGLIPKSRIYHKRAIQKVTTFRL